MAINRTPSKCINASVFAHRLREVRLRMGVSQDKLRKKIAMDGTVASTRISHYESGVQELPIKTARDIANPLYVQLCYRYCDHDRLAEIILAPNELPAHSQKQLLRSLKEQPQQIKDAQPSQQKTNQDNHSYAAISAVRAMLTVRCLKAQSQPARSRFTRNNQGTI